MWRITIRVVSQLFIYLFYFWKVGMDGYVTNPIEPVKLFQVLSQTIGKWIACDTIVDQIENRSVEGVSQKYLDGKKLLVVDDNNINRMVAKMMLEGSGAKIVLAEDGTQAVQMFADSEPGEY
jgi:two-component system sensor histidine kinase/response regulator